ncbi:OmpA family protein [Rahnella sp. SAP-1]|uniref:OmpA family protein n=1 Tax=Rouxiella aceris TaxID=2703884 RepID=A0A848MQ12_9GAMM|nr:OmpA family protein [Rouxiella aceris]NMP29885.1 OmpA family protein [Rouxiella aceris]
MNVLLQRLMAIGAAGLALLLIWVYFPLLPLTRWLLTLAVAALLALITISEWRSRRQFMHSAAGLTLPAEFEGALVLVCGDSEGLFAPGESTRRSKQGIYLAMATPDQLLATVNWLVASQSSRLPQLSLMLSVIPEQQDDEAVFRGQLHQWRAAIGQCRRRLPQLNLLLCGYFSAPIVGVATPWFVRDVQGTTVWQDDCLAQPLSEWMQQNNVAETFSQTVWLDSALSWLNKLVADELQHPRTALPAVEINLLAVTFRQGTARPDNLWQQFLQRSSLLCAPAACHHASRLPFPDLLLTILPQRPGFTAGQQLALNGGTCLSLFLICAMLASFINNQRLIRTISSDLDNYQQLSGNPAAPKLQAQQRLREHAQKLMRYQRQGEPQQLAMGLYQGGKLLPRVQRAVANWSPPTPPVPKPQVVAPAPQTLRLDTLSLFDIASAQLKPGATKVLINALVNIKAKPGWLIVIAGHSDATGHAQKNQQLSLARAESVRNWILGMSDIPARCIAVQGYGASQPIASNETAAGRAANRRVEIRLVPDSGACLAPASTADR